MWSHPFITSTASFSSFPFTVALGDPFVCVMLLPCIGWTVNRRHFVVGLLDVQCQELTAGYFFTNILFNSSVSTGARPFNRPRSSSLDPFIQSSLSIEPNISSPAKGSVKRYKEFNQSGETSYLVIGGGEARKEQHYANYQPDDSITNKPNRISPGTERNCFISPEKSCPLKSDKPETSSNSTAFTVAPSVSSSSSAPSSAAPLSPVSFDCNMKSPSSLHDSTISRLIDAVSLSNEQDTCGSISALIGQFESTVNQRDHGETSLCLTKSKPSTPKEHQTLTSPLKTNTPSAHKNFITSPQKVAPKTNHVSHETPFQAKTLACSALSSPETAELEEVYTILDEEVLLPISVYNLNKKTVPAQADTLESTPSNSSRPSPTKAVHDSRRERNVKWVDMHTRRGGSEEIEEVEERVYEEVFDPPAPLPEVDLGNSQRYIGSSVNSDFSHFRPDSARNTFAEVEINVDEDPQEIKTVLSRHGYQQDEHPSPTKRHAIYQNEEPTPNFSQRKQPSSYSDYQQQGLSRGSHLDFSPCLSPVNNRVFNHQPNQNNLYSSPFRRQANSRPPNPSPLHQNSYPIPQRNSEVFHNSRDISSSHIQQSKYKRSQILSRSHQDSPRQMEKELVSCPRNGFSSSEDLSGQHHVFTSEFSKDRGLYCPSSDCDAVYSLLDYGCITPQPESPAPQNTQAHYQNQMHSSTPKQPWSPAVSLNNMRPQSQFESRISLHSNESPLATKSLSGVIDPTVPSPCKSKSLGDLTSEDISCNFQSKYRIISRSFITPHMRKQRRKGMGDGTFQSQSCDPLTEQLRKLVSLEGDDSDRDRPQPPQLHLVPKTAQSQPQTSSPAPTQRDTDDSPPPLTRRLSSRSQSRVRHINSRARERQQEALKPRTGVTINSGSSVGGVVLRNKSTSQNPPPNRHSTGSYIAGYLGQLEDRGLPEGACTSLHYGNGDHYRDRFYTDDSFPEADTNHSASEPEVYFLLRL